jgi:uncharacterized protein (TIGR03067 family)
VFKLLSYCALCCLLSTVAAAADPPPPPAPAPALDGSWLPVKAELGGQPFPAPVLATMKLVLAGDRYTVFVGKAKDEGTVTHVPDTVPAALDITGVEGPNAGRTIPAIYQARGDTLEVCYNLGGPERPATFATASGTQQFLVTYCRIKP